MKRKKTPSSPSSSIPGAPPLTAKDNAALELIWAGIHLLAVLTTAGRFNKNDDGDILSHEDTALNTVQYADALVKRLQKDPYYRQVVYIMVQAMKEQP